MKSGTTAAPKSHEELGAKGLDKQRLAMTLILFHILNLHLTVMLL